MPKRRIPAARVMQQGFNDELVEDKAKNYELAGSAWRAGSVRRQSRFPMMEKAASLSEEGELYARLGSVYLDGDQLQKAH